MAVKITKTDNSPALLARLKKLSKARVLVGVPAAKSSRRKGQINNAEALYLFTEGSPLRGQPARPVLQPALNDPANKAIWLKQMENAAAAGLKGNAALVSESLAKAGTAAANAAREWFTNPRNGWATNAPATIRAKGSDVPGIDTSQMRRAITFLVDEDGKQ